MANTKFGELPRDAIVGVYMKVHTLKEGDMVVSVLGALFTGSCTTQMGWEYSVTSRKT